MAKKKAPTWGSEKPASPGLYWVDYGRGPEEDPVRVVQVDRGDVSALFVVTEHGLEPLSDVHYLDTAWMLIERPASGAGLVVDAAQEAAPADISAPQNPDTEEGDACATNAAN